MQESLSLFMDGILREIGLSKPYTQETYGWIPKCRHWPDDFLRSSFTLSKK